MFIFLLASTPVEWRQGRAIYVVVVS